MLPRKKSTAAMNVNRAFNRDNRNWISGIKVSFIALVLFMGLLPVTASAHPPKSVTLAYDTAAKVLKVTILHPSFAPSWHYVKTVAVTKNKKPLAYYSYTSQPGDEFTYTYEIPAVPGDTFVVTAYCSLYGTRVESLTIPSAKNP